MAVIVPQRIGGDVRGDHWLGAVSSRSARTHGWADDDAIDRVSVALWQAWRCAVPKAVAIQQQNAVTAACEKCLVSQFWRTE